MLICAEMKTIPRAIPAQLRNDTAECLGPTELPSLAEFKSAKNKFRGPKLVFRSGMTFGAPNDTQSDAKTKPIQLQLSPCAGAGPPISCFSVKCRLCLFPSAAAHSLARGRRSCSSVLVLKTIPKTMPKRSPHNCGCRRARGVASHCT